MKEDSYEYWYNEAMEAANDAGFAFMSAADVIKYQDAEIEHLRAEVARLEEIEWIYNKVVNDLKE